MRITGILIFIILHKIIHTDNRMLPTNYLTTEPDHKDEIEVLTHNEEYEGDKLTGLKSYEDKDQEEYGTGFERRLFREKSNKSCAVVVLSNIQNPTMQTLLRKYRYDVNGVLIPRSVRYFIKLPQGPRTSPLLVPLNDKAFTPLGGFVRYYKEIPPIPQSW